MSITYPPEMLPRPGADEKAEVVVCSDVLWIDKAEQLYRRIDKLEGALRGLLSYIDSGRDLSAQPSHPAHAARKLLEQ